MVEDGDPIIGVIATARDITERIQHEREERVRVRALEERVAVMDGGAASSEQARA